MTDKPKDHARVILPPPLLYAIPFSIGILLHHTVGKDGIGNAAKPFSVPLGVVLFAIGGLMASLASLAFQRAGTPRNPYRPTTAIVTSGPFRFTRNPMYLGLAFVYLGVALLVGYAWPLVFFPFAIFVVDRFVITHEEEYLEKKFGDTYRRYRESVRRWM